MWDNCIVDPRLINIMAGIVVAFFVVLAYSMYKATIDVVLPVHAVQSNAEDALVTYRRKVVSRAILLVGTVLATVLPIVDQITDVIFNVQIQKYLDEQKQIICDTFNQKGMFDSSGFSFEGKPYPSASEYGNFNEYIQKILVYFPVTDLLLRNKIQDSKTRCLSANQPLPLPPDCDYNAAEYACVEAAWVQPNQVFR